MSTGWGPCSCSRATLIWNTWDKSFKTVPQLETKPTGCHYWCCRFTATHRNPYILLYDVEGQAPEHDSLALLLLLHPVVGVLVLVITIRVITIFRSVTVMSLSPPLQDQVVMQSTQEDFNLYIKNSISRWLRGSVIDFIRIWLLTCTSGLSLSLRSSYRSLCLSSPQRRSYSLSGSLSRLSRHSASSRPPSEPYLPLRSLRPNLLAKTKPRHEWLLKDSTKVYIYKSF